MRKNTARVIAAWKAGQKDMAENSVWTDGEAIFSYGTCIAAATVTGRLVVNVEKYSVTTSEKQRGICYALRGIIAAEVRGFNSGAGPRDLLEKAATLEAAAENAARVMGEV